MSADDAQIVRLALEQIPPYVGAPERVAATNALERLVERTREYEILAVRVRDGLISDEDAVEELRFLSYRSR